MSLLNYFRTSAFLLPLLLVACAERTKAEGKVSLPIAADTRTDGASPPLGPAEPNRCPKGSRYSITIEGDGSPQRFSAGAGVIPESKRFCEPSFRETERGLEMTACATEADVRKSCVYLTEKHAAYFDREGKVWHLDVQGELRREGTQVAGKFTARPEADFVKAHPDRSHLELRLDVAVGNDVTLLDAPGLWGDGESLVPR